MEPKQEYYKITAEKIIEAFKKRNMKGLYCETKEEALKAVLDMVPDEATVGWGVPISRLHLQPDGHHPAQPYRRKDNGRLDRRRTRVLVDR